MEKKMKTLCYLFICAVTVLSCVSCSNVSPYDYGTNWLIRENDIPQYYSRFDLFYIGKAPSGYGDSHEIQFNWTKTHTNDIFGRGVRVFAPEIKNPDVNNVSKALEYYLEKYQRRFDRCDDFELGSFFHACIHDEGFLNVEEYGRRIANNPQNGYWASDLGCWVDCSESNVWKYWVEYGE
jgi:hypothetical protein